jgi:DNA-binding MarR family transcriptional regulator
VVESLDACKVIAYARILQWIIRMTDEHTKNALRLLQAADDFRAGLSGEFSAVHGISVNEFLMMLHLERAPANRLSRVEMAKRMHVSASTITRMAAPMEKIGLVGRDVDERDARLVFVVATDAGRRKLSEALATFSKRSGYLFDDRWDDEEVERFSSMLRRLATGKGETLA